LILNILKELIISSLIFSLVYFFQHLFFVEVGMAPIKDPSQMALAFFPPRFHWVPEHPLKGITYYTNILLETKSVHFKQIPDQKTGNKILYMRSTLTRLFFSKIGVTTLLSLECFPILSFPTAIMIIWMPGSNSCSTKIPAIIILGLLILITNFLSETCQSLWNLQRHFQYRCLWEEISYHKAFYYKIQDPLDFKNYVKEGDILDRHWFVKWWDKFPQTDAIIQTVYKDFSRKTIFEKSTSLGTPAVIPWTITTKLVTPSHFLPPPKEKKIASDKISDEKSVAASCSSSKCKKKKKGPSKNDMRMFQQFLKTFKEENNVEDSEDEEKYGSSSFSLDSANICGENRHLFGHDPLCFQDSILSIEDIPDLDY
jgi:hypothetical protein